MLARVVNGLAAVAGALAGAQFPTFYAHYVQEIGARLRQATEGLSATRALAEAEGVPIHEILERLRDAGPAGEAAYADLHGTYLVLKRLEPAYDTLTHANPVAQPLAFIRHFHPDIAAATFDAFDPALPLTAAGAAYGLFGLMLAVGLAWCILGACGVVLRELVRRRPRRANPGSTESRR